MRTFYIFLSILIIAAYGTCKLKIFIQMLPFVRICMIFATFFSLKIFSDRILSMK